MLNFGQERLLVTKCSIFPLLFCPKYHVQLFISAFLPHTAVWAMDHLWALSMPLWENPHPNFNYNLILMWKALIVNGFWWNLNMLFILVVSNSLGNLFDINQSLLNCCVVKKSCICHLKILQCPQTGTVKEMTSQTNRRGTLREVSWLSPSHLPQPKTA